MTLFEVQQLLPTLDRARQRRTGWTARCPAHDDHDPSLSIFDVGSGNYQMKCHAGCSLEEIRKALGMEKSNHQVTDKPIRKIAAEYDYTDENGEVLYQTVRYEPKGFCQRRPDGQGNWIWDLKGVGLVLYRLPAVCLSRSVLVVEGEKDVETAYRLGLPEGWSATCNPLGAGKWRSQYTEALRGKEVIILPDADDVGREHGQAIAQSVAGHATDIRILTLTQPYKDLTAWADKEGSQKAFRLLLESATPWVGEGAPDRDSSQNGTMVTTMKDLLESPVEEHPWLVEDRLPKSGLSVCVAKPKVGKSTLARNLALAVARGEHFLGHPVTQGPVLYVALEEIRSQIRAHFTRMGAKPNDPIDILFGPAPFDGFDWLSKYIERERPVLVIIDPIFRFVHCQDCNDYVEMTRVLDPIMTLARQHGVHILMVHHEGKGEHRGEEVVLGSTAISGVVDTILSLKNTSKFRTLQSTQRYGLSLPETVLTLDPLTGWAQCGPARAEADAQGVEQAILDYLSKQKVPVPETDVQKNVPGRRGSKVTVLRQLVEHGKVTKVGKGGKGDPFKYAIRQSADEASDAQKGSGK